jgi:hypothetical protein
LGEFDYNLLTRKIPFLVSWGFPFLFKTPPHIAFTLVFNIKSCKYTHITIIVIKNNISYLYLTEFFMTKKTKILVGVGALALYLLWKNKSLVNNTVTTVSNVISDDEKKLLFIATLGYQGGARPTQEMEERYDVKKKEALERIKLLDLSAELKAWKDSRKGEALPMSAQPQGRDFPMANFNF